LLAQSLLERGLSKQTEGKRRRDQQQRTQTPPRAQVAAGQISERKTDRYEQDYKGNPKCGSELAGVNDGHAVPVICRADPRPLDLR
jgi:hypothetical protein